MNKKSIIIIILAIILSLGIGGTAGYFLHKELKVEEKCKKEDEPKEERSEPTPQEPDKEQEKEQVEEPEKEPEEEEEEEEDTTIEEDEDEDEDYQLGMIDSFKYYNSRYFVTNRDWGADSPNDYSIYDDNTRELVFDSITEFIITKDNKVYVCNSMYNPNEKKVKKLNLFDKCLSIEHPEKDENHIIMAGIKNNKLQFYDLKANKYIDTGLTIDKTINPDLMIIEPYHQYGDGSDAYVGVGTTEENDNGEICLEYLYYAKDSRVEGFKTDCWGNLIAKK